MEPVLGLMASGSIFTKNTSGDDLIIFWVGASDAESETHRDHQLSIKAIPLFILGILENVALIFPGTKFHGGQGVREHSWRSKAKSRWYFSIRKENNSKRFYNGLCKSLSLWVKARAPFDLVLHYPSILYICFLVHESHPFYNQGWYSKQNKQSLYSLETHIMVRGDSKKQKRQMISQ